MDGFVIRQNVEHYRAMLKLTTDPAQRHKLQDLLREAEGHLREYEEGRKKK